MQRKRKYRGIFSSSICGMFETATKQSKTDACAMACCGVWLWERNYYISKRVLPKPWFQRKMEFACILFLFLWIISLNMYGQDNSSNSAGSEGTGGGADEDDDTMFFIFDPSSIVHWFLALSVGSFVYVMREFSTTRTLLRQQWAMEVFQQQYGPPPNETAASEAQQEYQLQLHQFFQ